AYPEDLRKHAAVTGFFGGEFKFESMNFLQKAIIKKVANTSESVYKLDRESIRQFADALNKA
ncbi:MAG: flavodoxin, partial [Candidatus Aminicenantes bacterium]|nr:flavodoxin [Candidatus Aminicenantes bacterium]